MSSAFRLLLSNCLNWKINCDDHSSLSSTTAVQKWIISYSYTSHHFTPHGRYELNKLTSLPMCGFIAQLIEQRTGDAEVTGSNLVKALIFFRLLLSNCLNWKIYCDDHSSLLLTYSKNTYSLLDCCFKWQTITDVQENTRQWWLLRSAMLLHENHCLVYPTPH